jgi:hypothetical protein
VGSVGNVRWRIIPEEAPGVGRRHGHFEAHAVAASPPSRPSPLDPRPELPVRHRIKTVPDSTPSRRGTVSRNNNSFNWNREELLHLLSNSANLAGLCVTVVALMNTFDRKDATASIVDDIYALCGAIFVLCIYVIFWTLRTHAQDVPTWLIRTIDGLFLLGMTSMTVASFLLIYTVW